MTTVGYGEIFPQTTEGRVVVSILLFAGILTFFGFLSTIASKIIKPTLELKAKQQQEKEGKRSQDKVIDNDDYDDDKVNGNYSKYNQQKINSSKNWLKDRIENIEVLDKSQFADFVITLTKYYNENYHIKQK